MELIRLKTDPETLRRRLTDRNQPNDANSVTVSDELLERYFANFEEPIGEGERVIVQEYFPRSLVLERGSPSGVDVGLHSVAFRCCRVHIEYRTQWLGWPTCRYPCSGCRGRRGVAGPGRRGNRVRR